MAQKALSFYHGALMTVPGNHDDRKADAAVWRLHFGSDAGLDRIDGVQFLRLNTADGRLNKPANIAAMEQLDINTPAVIFSHMQLVPDDYLNDKEKVIRDSGEVQPWLEKIGRSKSIIYIGHKNVATHVKWGRAEQINIPQTTQFPPAGLKSKFTRKVCCIALSLPARRSRKNFPDFSAAE